jgi:hypothetical protein
MTKEEIIKQAMFAAMKAGDKERKEALNLLAAAIKQVRIDTRKDLSESEEDAIIAKEVKQLKEANAMADASRQEFIDRNNRFIAIMSEFLPRQMTEDQIKAEIAAVLAELGIEQPQAKDKGVIMKNLMPRVKGKADGKQVNDILAGLFA